jgi:hypothetical protein
LRYVRRIETTRATRTVTAPTSTMIRPPHDHVVIPHLDNEDDYLAFAESLGLALLTGFAAVAVRAGAADGYGAPLE